jgi:endogenous inhibitor of DNA gyrase (YacG/DUF329 family)
MSLFKTISITCPACDTPSEFEAVGSVNADRRPDLRAQILDNSFQTLDCPNCGAATRLVPDFNYLDMELGLWIAAKGPQALEDYLAQEDAAAALFDQSYGPQATAAAQEVGSDLTPRLTFGWPALREKILLRQAGLEDVVIELLKLDLLRRLPEAPFGPGIELRCVAVAEESLEFLWLEAASEADLGGFAADRALLREVEENPEGWAALRASLTDGLFVDMQKLYIGEGRHAA